MCRCSYSVKTLFYKTFIEIVKYFDFLEETGIYIYVLFTGILFVVG